MLAVKYTVNGNQFLSFKDKCEVNFMYNECNQLINRDNRLKLFYNNPFLKGFDTKQLEATLSTIREVDTSDYTFPTERPRVNLDYLEHPIRTNVFIPVDKYNKYIQDERKWELIKILRCYGAKKILFNKTGKNVYEDESKIASYVFKNDIIDFYSEDYKLEFDKLDKEVCTPDSVWLTYEPEWQGIINTMELGLKKGAIDFTTEVSGMTLVKLDKSFQKKKSVTLTVSKVEFET